LNKQNKSLLLMKILINIIYHINNTIVESKIFHFKLLILIRR